MSDVVERAQAALKGVTRGPWKLGNRAYPEVVHTPSGCLWHPVLGFINHTADGEFIAQARTLVPELVAEVERLRAREAAAAEESYRAGQRDAEVGQFDPEFGR